MYDPLVKWLRHRPFTAVTWVQIPYGSLFGGLAQLGEHLPYKQGVTGSNPVSSISFQLVRWSSWFRTPACHAGDHEFESRTDRCYVFTIEYTTFSIMHKWKLAR